MVGWKTLVVDRWWVLVIMAVMIPIVVEVVRWLNLIHIVVCDSRLLRVHLLRVPLILVVMMILHSWLLMLLVVALYTRLRWLLCILHRRLRWLLLLLILIDRTIG